MSVPRDPPASRRKKRQRRRRCFSTSRRGKKQTYVGCQRSPPRLLQRRRRHCGAQEMDGHSRQHRSKISFDCADTQNEERVGQHGELAYCVGTLPQRRSPNTQRNSAGDLFLGNVASRATSISHNVGDRREHGAFGSAARRRRFSADMKGEEEQTSGERGGQHDDVRMKSSKHEACAPPILSSGGTRRWKPLSCPTTTGQRGMAIFLDTRRRYPSATSSATSTFSTPSSSQGLCRRKIQAFRRIIAQ